MNKCIRFKTASKTSLISLKVSEQAFKSPQRENA